MGASSRSGRRSGARGRRRERRTGRRVAPIFQYRWGAGSQKLKRLLDAGVPGRLLVATSETMWKRGDAYYVIEHGRFQVDVDGRPARILDRPGDGFGEIALLREVPRTATVTAVDEAVVLVVRRDDFLAAVTGNPPARDVAERMVTERI